MLSEEMLSIKQRFFEKDLVQSTTVKIKQNSAPTPTVEVQQKWSVVNLFTNSVIDEQSESDEVTTFVEDKNDIIIDSENSLETDLISDDLKSNNKSENKILELRSLPSARHAETNQNHAQVLPCANNHNLHAIPKCSCSRPDHHRCTRCTHTVTDTSVSYSVYPLYLQPYQTFLFSDNLENPYENLYYHPKVVDDLKIPKKTKRRKTRPPPADLYYDDNGSKEIDDDDGYSLRPKKKRPNIVMNIDYDLVDDKPKNSNCKKDDGNNFNLINDLNEVFHDGANKKCYCSQSTLILPKQKNTLFIFMFFVSIFSLQNYFISIKFTI